MQKVNKSLQKKNRRQDKEKCIVVFCPSLCVLNVCMLSHPNAIYFIASHWPWDHMISFQAPHWSIPAPLPVDTTCGPNSWTWLVDSTQIMDLTCGPNSWIVPMWNLKNKELLQIGLVDWPRFEAFDWWSFKNKELFLIGLVDCPCVEP